MALHRRLTRASIELVKQFEGLRRTAARLEGGGWTIGYGHTVSAREGTTVDESAAEALLMFDLDRSARLVDDLTFTPLNDNQFSALVAFAFSVGAAAFRRSDVLKRVNEGALLQAAAEIELWRLAEFEDERLVVDALVRRRAAEKLLFLTPPEGFHPLPSAVVPPLFDAAAPELRARADGLAGAVGLRTPLDGPVAVSERDEAEPAAASAYRKFRPFAAEATPAAAPEPEDEPPPPPLLPPAMLAPPSSAFGRKPVAAAPLFEPGAPSTAAERVARIRAPVEIGAGIVGALMFVGALLGIVYARASLAGLAIGLVGVVLMAPAAQRLVSGLFDRLSDSR